MRLLNVLTLVLALLAPGLARAETPPMFEAKVAWSQATGPYVEAQYVYATSLPILHIVAGGEVGLESVGHGLGDVAEVKFREGVPPSHLFGGVAADYQFTAGEHFDGWLRGALYVGVADTQYAVMAGGSATIDIRYLRLDGVYNIFGNSRASSTYGFSGVIRPYVQWLNLEWGCDSRDGWTPEGAENQNMPCGVGAGLYFDLPGTPVHLGVHERITFHDLRGNTSDAKGHVSLTVSIDY